MLNRVIENREDPVIRPLVHTGRPFYILAVIMIILVVWFMYAWITQLVQGLYVTDMRTPVGAGWGIYISNFVFFCLHGSRRNGYLRGSTNIKSE